LRGETRVTPIIIVINLVPVCKSEAHAIPYITIISFIQVSRGEEYETPCIAVINFVKFKGVKHTFIINNYLCESNAHRTLSLTIIYFTRV
jgi:hypothetical protein